MPVRGSGELADLAADCAVVHYDQLGNSRSTHYPDRGAEFWTPELFVRELHNLVAVLRIADRHHVLGQSWGGFLAQEYALTQPAGLRSLVLADTAASWADFATEAGKLRAELQYGNIDEILATGLHAFLTQFLDRVNELGSRISRDFLVPATI